jgi:hypothetical protein
MQTDRSALPPSTTRRQLSWTAAAVLLVLVLLDEAAECRGWLQLLPSGSRPAPRQGHTAVVWADRVMVVFGGRTVSSSVLNSTASLLSYANTSCTAIGGCNELSGAGVCDVCALPPCQCSCADGFTGLNCEVAAVDSWLSDVAAFDVVDRSWRTFTADPVGTISPVPWSDTATAERRLVAEKRLSRRCAEWPSHPSPACVRYGCPSVCDRPYSRYYHSAVVRLPSSTHRRPFPELTAAAALTVDRLCCSSAALSASYGGT